MDHQVGVDHRAKVDQQRGLNPLYVGVPTACALIILSVVIVGVFLVRYGRAKGVHGREKAVSLLPSYSTPVPASGPCLELIESSESHEPCICLQCNRPVFVPAKPAHSVVETPS